LYLNGESCWKAGAREARVRLRCGEATELTDVEEPSTCRYLLTMTTPAACKTTHVEELRDRLRGLEAEAHRAVESPGPTPLAPQACTDPTTCSSQAEPSQAPPQANSAALGAIKSPKPSPKLSEEVQQLLLENQTHEGIDRVFQSVDTNGDGLLNKEEFAHLFSGQ